jgi:hypothetical protein
MVHSSSGQSMSPTSRRKRRVTASVESTILCSVRQRHNGSTRDQYFLYVAHECSGPCYVMRASIGNGSHPQTYPSETYIGVLDPTYLHTNFALDFFILGYHIRAHYLYDSPFILQCRFVFESPIAYTPIPKKKKHRVYMVCLESLFNLTYFCCL